MTNSDDLSIQLPKELREMLLGFLPVARKIMDNQDFSVETLAFLALSRGLKEMLVDIIGNDAGILISSYKKMFSDNPKYLGQFIFNALESGESIIDNGTKKDLTDRWKKEPIYT